MSETREYAYERAAELYADALRTGGKALSDLGSEPYRLKPTPAEFHLNVLAVAEFLVTADPVPPGACWAEAGVVWPGGVSPRCELRAGHAGAHECDRGAMGGTATWTDVPAAEGTADA